METSIDLLFVIYNFIVQIGQI